MLQSSVGKPGYTIQREIVGGVVQWDDGDPNSGRRDAAVGEVRVDAQPRAYADCQHPQQEHEHRLQVGREVLRTPLVRLRPLSQQRRLAVSLRHGCLTPRVVQGYEPVHTAREV